MEKKKKKKPQTFQSETERAFFRCLSSRCISACCPFYLDKLQKAVGLALPPGISPFFPEALVSEVGIVLMAGLGALLVRPMSYALVIYERRAGVGENVVPPHQRSF